MTYVEETEVTDVVDFDVVVKVDADVAVSVVAVVDEGAPPVPQEATEVLIVPDST